MTLSKTKQERIPRSDRPIAELIEAKFAQRLAAVGIVRVRDWVALSRKAKLSIFGIPADTSRALDSAIAAGGGR